MPYFFWKPRPPALPSASRARREGSRHGREGEPGEAAPERPNVPLQRSVGNQALQRLHERDRGRKPTDSDGRNEAEALLDRLGPGRPLDASLARRLAGPGVDPASVRLHTDTTATRLTAEKGARAFTVGDHIAFAPGQLRPGTLTGDALLAHELAHVEQQRRGGDQAGTPSEVALEADADRSAAGHLLSRLTGAGRRLGASLSTGLRLQGCFLFDSGPEASLEDRFVGTNTGWTGDLETEHTDRIQAAITRVAGDNPALREAFYRYFSSHEINRMTGTDLEEAREVGRYAETSGGSDMAVDPRILAEGFDPATLGTLMFHELVHTRHPGGNPLGMGDYLEGEAYAVEYFLARRAGAEERLGEIAGIMAAHMHGQDTYRAAWRSHFRDTYGAINLLQMRADGADLPAGAPEAIRSLTPEQAQSMMADLLVTRPEERSAALQGLLDWVHEHRDELDMPI